MRPWTIALVIAVVSCSPSSGGDAPPPPSQGESLRAIGALLDDFHLAAAEPDEARYFSHFSSLGVFLGTDPAERWTVSQFREYAHGRFATGTGWTYVPSSRTISIAPSGTAAWFDEVVTNAKYGACRGTGALIYQDGAWKLAQYSLSLPLPNDMFPKIADDVKAFAARAKDEP